MLFDFKLYEIRFLMYNSFITQNSKLIVELKDVIGYMYFKRSGIRKIQTDQAFPCIAL